MEREVGRQVCTIASMNLSVSSSRHVSGVSAKFSAKVICQVLCTSWFVLKGEVVALVSELVFQDSWWRFSSTI